MKIWHSIIPMAAVATLFLSDASSTSDLPKEKKVESPGRISQLFSKTKLVCVGRYLLEVPEKSTVVYGPANTPYRIERYANQASHFNLMVNQFAREALSKKSKFPIGPASSPGSMVGRIDRGAGSNNMIVYGVDASTGAFYSIQSLIVVGNDVYVQEHSYYGDPTEIGRVIEELKSVASNLVPRKTDGPPTKAGICIDGALVLDGAPSHHERITVGVRLAKFTDVHFTMDMTLKDRILESDSLEAQLKSGEETAKSEGRGEWYSRVKFIRRAERQISNWRGYEALVRRPPQGRFNSTHEFAFVSHGEPNNPMLPMINLDLHTGIQDNTVGIGTPSLSDSETVELWDRLTQSIRPLNFSVK